MINREECNIDRGRIDVLYSWSHFIFFDRKIKKATTKRQTSKEKKLIFVAEKKD